MNIIRPLLEYLGIGDCSESDAMPPPENVSPLSGRRLLKSLVLTTALLMVAFSVGWRMRGDTAPAFAARTVVGFEDALASIDQVGAECDEPLEIVRRDGNTFATCRGSRRFDLHVFGTIDEAYESFDLATLLGCYTVGDLPHKQWFLIRGANWNLLTHHRGLVGDLERLRNVTVTTGGCDAPSTGMVV